MGNKDTDHIIRESRDDIINARVTKKEKKKVIRRAGNLSISDYIRLKVLGDVE